jgi:hypothetical protein
MRARTTTVRMVFVVAAVVAMLAAFLMLSRGFLTRSERQAEAMPTRYGDGQCPPNPMIWQAQGSEFGELMIHNTLEIGDHRIGWNGVSIDRPTLDRYFGEMRAFPSAHLVVVFEPQTRCSEAEAIRRAVSATLDCGKHRSCVEYSALAWMKQSAARAVPQPSRERLER